MTFDVDEIQVSPDCRNCGRWLMDRDEDLTRLVREVVRTAIMEREAELVSNHCAVEHVNRQNAVDALLAKGGD